MLRPIRFQYVGCLDFTRTALYVHRYTVQLTAG
jgi:hypothetical protein